MNKMEKIILSLFSLLIALQFILIIILYNRYTVVLATRSQSNQSLVASISSERATEVALDYVSRGIAGDVTLVNEHGAWIYAVDINYDNINYVIYVDGEIGAVVWLTREQTR